MRRRRLKHARVLAPESPGAIVAFEAESEYDRPGEQFGVCRTVRHVARFAPFHSNARMFKYERSALVRMAFQTGLFVVECGPERCRTAAHARRGRRRSMRIVAIAALHHAFIDAMLRRHFKLGALRRVTRITEFGLWLGEKGSGGRRLVNGMTVGADYIGLGMRRPPDIGARNIFRMTGEARFEDRCGAEYGKGLDGRLPAMSIH